MKQHWHFIEPATKHALNLSCLNDSSLVCD